VALLFVGTLKLDFLRPILAQFAWNWSLLADIGFAAWKGIERIQLGAALRWARHRINPA